MPGAPDQLYVLARRVLLDALVALTDHHGAIILVGAQALYLYTGEGELATAPYTTDGDLVLDPDQLGPVPILEQTLAEAGFSRASADGALGTWIGRDNVQIDLMVPTGVAPPGSGRRSVALGPHGNRTARTARGLEAALIDQQVMELAALDPADGRKVLVKVAGPSALLIAKLHKLADRRHSPRRQDDKDALDIYRLLQAISTETFSATIRTLLDAGLSAAITTEALTHLTELFADADAEGAQMAARAVVFLDDPDTVAASCAALAQDLLQALQPPADLT